MNLSVGKKTFIGAMAVAVVTSVLMLVGQIYFFPKYYTRVITDKTKSLLTDFSKEYSNCRSDEEIMAVMGNYSKSGDVYIAVMSSEGDLLHMLSYEMNIKTDGGNARVTLDNAIRSEQLYNMNLQKGDYVTVEYKKPKKSDGESIYVPDRIISDKGTWQRGGIPEDDNADFQNGILSGEIVSITLPVQQSLAGSIQRREAFSAVMDWRRRFNLIGVRDEAYYFYRDEDTDNPYMVMAEKIEQTGEYVLAISPLKVIGEANDVSKRLGKIWIIAGIATAAVIAHIFSRSVSKPITAMTEVTRKMRHLDFSEKCRVKSKDEVGILAENINDMSEKLDNTIKQLRRANNKLKKDIEHERMLENQRKDFVAAVSHELKTPLAVIQAYAEGIMDGISGDNLDKYLKIILDETNRMDKLVLEMLENSKLEAGAEQPQMKENDLAQQAKNIVKIFAKSASDYEITIVSNIPEDKIIKCCDIAMIERVMMNFMSNAVVHTPKGGKIILTVTDEIFSIENEGENIPEEEIKFIWDKFYKIDKSRTRAGGGTGLGLSIAKNILILHKAEYGAENTGTGVKFWFKLK